MWGEDASIAGDNIPAQKTLPRQIALHWQPFKDLNQSFVVSCRAEQLRLHSQQRIVSTVEDSVLRTEMGRDESWSASL